MRPEGKGKERKRTKKVRTLKVRKPRGGEGTKPIEDAVKIFQCFTNLHCLTNYKIQKGIELQKKEGRSRINVCVLPKVKRCEDVQKSGTKEMKISLV